MSRGISAAKNRMAEPDLDRAAEIVDMPAPKPTFRTLPPPAGMCRACWVQAGQAVRKALAKGADARALEPTARDWQHKRADWVASRDAHVEAAGGANATES